MPADGQFCFEPYRLEVRNARLWCGSQELHLTAKAFDVLCYLVQHADQLVTKDDLFAAVWPETTVSERVLTNCVNELRKALGETAQAPRYIATVYGRGYRFIAPVTLVGASAGTVPLASATAVPVTSAVPPLLVGRETEVHALRQWLVQVLGGQRHVVLVSGEAGMGKTTVVDAFLATTASEPPLWVAWGQCLAQYGTGEAYLPVLDALGRLCRTPGHGRLIALLGQYAPTWLVQMPALLSTAALEDVQRKVQGATRERMLRELAEALEVLTAEQPLALVLEDLHWSDHATLDLLAWLARRREPARLLVLGTYRPVEVIVQGHPLYAVKQELALHRQCVELPLEGLSEAAVAAYLTARFPGWSLPADLARVLHRRTEGQPLFMVQTVDAWVQQGWIHEVAGQWGLQVGLETVETAVPESVRQMIVQQFEGLSAAQQAILESASIVGVEFATAAVATGVEGTIEEVEAQCETLARRGQFVQRRGVEEWPDGTVTERYAFVHALHQHVVYQRLPVGRRLQLHRRIGARLEAGYGQRAGEHAAELALHFATGRDHGRAVPYLQQAAENALRRWAYAEALGHLQRALALLLQLPDTPQRRQQELAFQLALGQTWIATRGPAAAEVETAYTRAQTLCMQVGEMPQHLDVLRGLSRHYLMRAAYRKVQTLGAERLRLAERLQEPALLVEAHAALGSAAFYLGELATAQTHFTQGIEVDGAQPPAPMAHYAQDPRGICLTFGAQTRWLLGYPDQALALLHQALAHARALAQPFGLGMALGFAATLSLLRGEWPAAQEHAEAARRLALEHGLGMMTAQGLLLQGAVLAAQGHHAAGLAQMQQAMAAIQAAGQEAGRLFAVALLAEQYGQAGQVEAGLRVLTETLASLNPQEPRLWEPELHRVRGTLLFRTGGVTLDACCQAAHAEAETCFQQALTLARRQGARAFELRAATGLSQLWHRQGKRQAAHQLLAAIYGRFTEGFDTADLQEAKALLEALA